MIRTEVVLVVMAALLFLKLIQPKGIYHTYYLTVLLKLVMAAMGIKIYRMVKRVKI